MALDEYRCVKALAVGEIPVRGARHIPCSRLPKRSAANRKPLPNRTVLSIMKKREAVCISGVTTEAASQTGGHRNISLQGGGRAPRA